MIRARIKLLSFSIVGVSILLCLSGCGNGDQKSAEANGGGQIAITGAGSTFVQPVMEKWLTQYQKDHPGFTINYQSIGSGAGISQYQAGTIDFGATDAPLNDSQLKGLGKKTIIFPIACGCEAMCYNLPSLSVPLKLSGDLIANIYLGVITKWNDPRIAAENPGLNLPNEGITVVHRSDASGTTYIFTSYLTAISEAWKRVGADKSVSWPIGIGGSGNSGVAGDIKNTAGSIGYVELAYAIQTKMPAALLKNASGKYLLPSLDGTTAAEAASATLLNKDLRTPIVNAPGEGSYPIAGFTYALVQTDNSDPAKAKAVVDFLTYCIGDGQELGKSLQYAPLPPNIIELNKNQLSKVATQ